MTVIKIGCPDCGMDVPVDVPDDDDDHTLDVTCPGCRFTSRLTITEGEIGKIEPQEGSHPPPVKKGEILEVKIEGVLEDDIINLLEIETENSGEKGTGIAHAESCRVVVPDTDQGERVRIRITDYREGFGFAEVVERLSDSG